MGLRLPSLKLFARLMSGEPPENGQQVRISSGVANAAIPLVAIQLGQPQFAQLEDWQNTNGIGQSQCKTSPKDGDLRFVKEANPLRVSPRIFSWASTWEGSGMPL